MTLTALMRKRNPPTEQGFERWTLGGALWQLKASCDHHGRKMLRVCLMLLREEAQALDDLRTLDEWADERPGCCPFMTFPGPDREWLCCRIVRGEYVDIHRGNSADEARSAAAKWCRAKTSSRGPKP